MILWLSAYAFAQMPAHVDQDKVEDWEAAAAAAMRGPKDACWAINGTTAVSISLHQPPRVFSRAQVTKLERAGTFVGILNGGTWTRFDVNLVENGKPSTQYPIARPFVGTIPSDVLTNINAPVKTEPESNEETHVHGSTDIASELLLDLIDASWTKLASTSFIQWDDEQDLLELVVEAPLQEQSPNDVVRTVVRFPGAGPVPTAVDTVLPKRVTVGGGVLRARLLSAQLHVRGIPVGEQFLPSLETMSGVIGAMGMTVGYDQRIIYQQASECTAKQLAHRAPKPKTPPSAEAPEGVTPPPPAP